MPRRARRSAQPLDRMSYTLRYTSSRAEVWHCYWRLWRARLWWLHAVLAIALTALLARRLDASDPGHLVLYFSGALISIVCLSAVWPQLKFKDEERTLNVGPEGWSTAVGDVSGRRSWSEVDAVQSVGEAVEIRSSTGNALIVPLRAFSSAEQMHRFVGEARAWHEAMSGRGHG